MAHKSDKIERINIDEAKVVLHVKTLLPKESVENNVSLDVVYKGVAYTLVVSAFRVGKNKIYAEVVGELIEDWYKHG